jgi:hypothetical protein
MGKGVENYELKIKNYELWGEGEITNYELRITNEKETCGPSSDGSGAVRMNTEASQTIPDLRFVVGRLRRRPCE